LVFGLGSWGGGLGKWLWRKRTSRTCECINQQNNWPMRYGSSYGRGMHWHAIPWESKWCGPQTVSALISPKEAAAGATRIIADSCGSLAVLCARPNTGCAVHFVENFSPPRQVESLKTLVVHLGPALNAYLRSIGRNYPQFQAAKTQDLSPKT
jgi:hypothetical protein